MPVEQPGGLCLFGGAFDPPHRTHERIVRAALAQLPIDRLVVVPSGRHPHKDGELLAPAAARLEMCRAAFAGIDGAVISEFELRRPGLCYTVDTLRFFGERHAGEARPFLLIGSDNLSSLRTWHRPDDVLRLAQLAVYPRAGTPVTDALLRRLGLQRRQRREILARVLDVEPDAVSSTDVRARLRQRLPCEHLLHPGVLAVIRARGLYTA